MTYVTKKYLLLRNEGSLKKIKVKNDLDFFYAFGINIKKTIDKGRKVKYNRYTNYGVIAQLVARLNGIQKVRGSTPLSSTKKIAFTVSLSNSRGYFF